MRTVSIPRRRGSALPASRRLLALAGDERLVDQIRRGNEAAFEVAFERYGGGILGFCRHMLGSQEEAEDAVQQTFASAYRDLLRDDRAIALKPWLYTIARNRCLSMLRARREEPGEPEEVATAGLAEEVERRAELRAMLADLRELPEDQRAALLLSELGDLSHAEVADVLGCEASRVKALVYRARTGLIQRREAREMPCEEIREQLANLRGGSLRRSELRHHLRQCEGCRSYREQVKQQRALLGVALPVVPSLGLKSSVLAAIGIGGGAGGGGALGGALGGSALGGSAGGAAAAGGGVLGSLGGVAAKLAVVGVLAGGGVVAGDAVVDRDHGSPDAAAPAASEGVADPVPAAEATEGLDAAAERGRRRGEERSAAARGKKAGERGRRVRARGRAGAPGQAVAEAKRGHGRTKERPAQAQDTPRGRGPIEAPPAQTPVQRGPVEPRPQPQRPAAIDVEPPGPAPKPEKLPKDKLAGE